MVIAMSLIDPTIHKRANLMNIAAWSNLLSSAAILPRNMTIQWKRQWSLEDDV
jgi:hypothetical protein